MSERYDAVLAHVYQYSYHSGKPKSSLRGHMQVSALTALYKKGEIGEIFIAGGKVWGDDYPSLAQVMSEELQRRSIPQEKIIAVPEAKDTSAEVDLFLKTSQERGWKKVASLANKSHVARVQDIYDRREKAVPTLSAETILEEASGRQGRYSYRGFLGRFTNSTLESKFRSRERKIRLVYKLRGEFVTALFSKLSRGRRFQPNFDC